MADHAGHRASQGRFVDHSTGILRFQYPHPATKSGPLFAFHAYEPRKDAKAQKGNTLGGGHYAHHLIFEVQAQSATGTALPTVLGPHSPFTTRLPREFRA